MAPQPLELEVLDQLLCEDLTLDVIRRLFATDQHFVAAIGGMLAGGDVHLHDGEGRVMPDWMFRVVLSDPSAWASGSPYRLSVTAKGAQRV